MARNAAFDKNLSPPAPISLITPGYFRINDIVFDIPPQNIQIIKRDQNLNIPTLRTGSSTKVKSGHKEVLMIVDLIFATGYNYSLEKQQTAQGLINTQLAPLIIQTRKCPFCSIENEKIRNEMAGELGQNPGNTSVKDYKQMAAVIQSVRITTDLNSPKLLNVQVVMKWFNYSPFSTNFKYLHNVKVKTEIKTEEDMNSLFAADNRQHIIPVNSPEFSQYYQAFYKNQTYVNGNFINAISGFSNDIEIFYREYKDINPLPSDPSSDQALGGWRQTNSRLKFGKDLLYRYRNFRIDGGTNRLHSDELIPISLEILLETKVPMLPLLSHTTAVPQFLGVSDASINISLFANAKMVNKTPVASSSKLASLSTVLEKVTQNSIFYRALSKRDPIFIRHPILKLLQYNLYNDESKSLPYTNERGEPKVANKSEMIPCIVNATDTSTIPDSPFCNKVDIQLLESYKSLETDKLTNQGMGRDIFDTLLENLLLVGENLDIQFDPVQYKYTSRFANMDLFNIKRIFKSEENKDIATKAQLSKKILKLVNSELGTPIFNAQQSIAEPSWQDLLRSSFNDENPSDSRTREIEILTNELTRFALHNRPDYLQKFTEELATFNTVDPKSTYPDMKLPIDIHLSDRREVGLNPDFYWDNVSDREFEKIKTRGIPLAKESYVQNWGEHIAESYKSSTDPDKLQKGILPFGNPPLLAGNTEYNDGKETNRSSKNLVHDFGLESQSLTLQNSIESLIDKTYTMRRTMPTFKLFFLNDSGPVDKGERRNVWLNFEDFYNVNSVKEIRLIKDKNLAPDTLMIQLVNMDRDLAATDFPIVRDEGRLKYTYGVMDGKLITERDKLPKLNQQFDRLMLNEGTKVQLRLGTDADPDNLAIEFNGRISQISGSDVLEIVCQSHAIELEQEVKGIIPSTSIFANSTYSYNAETNDLISKILFSSNEIQNFGNRGRHKILGTLDLARYAFSDWSGGMSLTDNIIAPPNGWSFISVLSDELLDLFFINLQINSVQKTEITASIKKGGTALLNKLKSQGGTVVKQLGKKTLSAGLKKIVFPIFATLSAWKLLKQSFIFCPFYVYQQTVWDIIKELELRHPDCVARAVPFDTRMTLFFGHPDQLYFYRGPHLLDSLKTPTDVFGFERSFASYRNSLADEFKQEWTDTGMGILTGKGLKISHNPSDISFRLTKEKINQNPKTADDFKKMSQYLKPFRNYHMVSSEHDIILNNIRTDSEDTYNAVTLLHPEDGSDANLDGSSGFEDYEQYQTVKADDDLHPNFIRTGTFTYHNARKWGNVDLPREYSLSLLKRSLERIYKGELVILGREGINPYDIVFIFDMYTNIIGAIEVERVVQTLSYETGWTTEITPNLVMFTNNMAGRAHLEALKNIWTTAYVRNRELFFSSVYDNKSIPAPSELITYIPPDPLLESTSAIDLATTAAGGVAGLIAIGIAARGLGSLKGKWKANQIRLSPSLKSGQLKGQTMKQFSKAVAAGQPVITELPASFKGLGSMFKSVAIRGFAIAGLLQADNITNSILSFGRNRQPIIMVPLVRDGKPWHLGLYGWFPDLTMESVEADVNELWHEYKHGTLRFVNKLLDEDLLTDEE